MEIDNTPAGDQLYFLSNETAGSEIQTRYVNVSFKIKTNGKYQT
jgi:hypothetical protein